MDISPESVQNNTEIDVVGSKSSIVIKEYIGLFYPYLEIIIKLTIPIIITVIILIIHRKDKDMQKKVWIYIVTTRILCFIFLFLLPEIYFQIMTPVINFSN